MKVEYGGGKWFSVVSVKYFTLVVCTLFGTSAHAETSNQEVSAPPLCKRGVEGGVSNKISPNPSFQKKETKRLRQEVPLKQYKNLLAQQQKEFQKQRVIITEQGKELDKLKERLDSLLNQVTDNNKQSSTNRISNQPLKTAEKNQPSRLPNQELPSKPVGQAPPVSKEKPRPPEIPRLSDTVGGVLTRQGKIVVEPTLQYGYTSNNRVFLDAFTFLPALAVGLIDLREVDRHAFMGSLGARYGLTDRLELEFRAPYVYRNDSQRSRPVSIGAGIDETFNATGNGIGDLEFTGRYQLTGGSGGWPILVGNLVATFPTGKSPFEVKYVEAKGVPGAKFPTELPTGAGSVGYINVTLGETL